MKTFIQHGTHMDVSLAAAATAGVPIVVGTGKIGIPETDGAIGDVISCRVKGVVLMPKASLAVIAQGEQVLWDDSAGNVDDDQATPDTGDFLCGVAWAPAGSGSTEVPVSINETAPAVT